MDEEINHEEIEPRLSEVEQQLEELIESLDGDALERPDGSNISVIDQEFRQVIVHWIEEADCSSITSTSDAKSAFLTAAIDRNKGTQGDRRVGHGDLMVIGCVCKWICYVARVDRTDDFNVGFQPPAPSSDYAEQYYSDAEEGSGVGPDVAYELIVWQAESHSHTTVHVPNITVNGTVPVATFGTPVNASLITNTTQVSVVDSVTPTQNAAPITASTTLTTNTVPVPATVTPSTTTTEVVTGLDTPAYTTETLTVDNSNGEILGVNTTSVHLPSTTTTSVPTVTGATLVNPVSLGNTHTYNVDVGTLKEVWEQEVQVCILDPSGSPTTCTLTILATSKTGSGCDDFSDPPDGWFFKPIDADSNPATDSIPQITIPRDDINLTAGTPVQVAVRDTNATNIATGLNRSTNKVTPSLPYNTGDVEIVTGVNLDTTHIVTGVPTVEVAAGSVVTGSSSVTIPANSLLTGVTTGTTNIDQYTSQPISVPQAGTASTVPDITVNGTIPVASAPIGCEEESP